MCYLISSQTQMEDEKIVKRRGTYEVIVFMYSPSSIVPYDFDTIAYLNYALFA